MSTKEHSLLVEKYRSKDLTEYVGNEHIKTFETINLKDAGIIDPFKVTRSALQNASSIAGTILLTECTIVDNPESKQEEGIDTSMFGM